MALALGGLKSEVRNIFSGTHPSHVVTAQKLSDAVGKYWETGKHPLNGIPSAAAAKPLLFVGLIKAFTPFQTSPVTTANAVADALLPAALALIITGSPFGFGGVLSIQRGAALSGLIKSYSNTANFVEHANAWADAVHAFTLTNLVFGTGTPPAVPPPTGPFT